jgi:hypothetical protein
MFAAFVTFESEDLDDARLRKIAAEARGMFEVMPNLRAKLFTIDADRGRATNVYVWQSEEAARVFFSDQLIERVTELYGVEPHVEFAEILELVDNAGRDA